MMYDPNEHIRRLNNQIYENDEIILNLRCIVATVEADAKLEADKSLKHIQSELSFKVTLLLYPP